MSMHKYPYDGSHLFHPLSFHPFSNSASEKRCTAHCLARCRSAKSSSSGRVSTVWKAFANVSGEVAW